MNTTENMDKVSWIDLESSTSCVSTLSKFALRLKEALDLDTTAVILHKYGITVEQARAQNDFNVDCKKKGIVSSVTSEAYLSMIELMNHYEDKLFKHCKERPALKKVVEKIFHARNSPSQDEQNEESNYFENHTIPKTSVYKDSNGSNVVTTTVRTLNTTKIHAVLKQHEDDDSETMTKRKKFYKDVLTSHSINNTEIEMFVNATDAVVQQDIGNMMRRSHSKLYLKQQNIAKQGQTMIIEEKPFKPHIPSCVGIDVMEVFKKGLSQNDMYKKQDADGKKRMISEEKIHFISSGNRSVFSLYSIHRGAYFLWS